MPVTTPLAPVELLAVVEPLLLEVVAALPVPANDLPEDELPEDELPPLPLREEVGLGVGVPLLDGVGLTVKLAALVASPPGVVTLSGPLLAPAGTVAVICVSLFTMKRAPWPTKATAVAPVKPPPIRVTVLPTGPDVGTRAVIVGIGAGVGVGAASASIVLSMVAGAATVTP
jgi:hypothetical protein